jgi:hypothetical protein
MVVLESLSRNIRFAAEMGRFLRETMPRAEAHRLVEAQLAARDERFLSILQESVYDNADSPYLQLLRHAGIELGDLRAMVEASGIEATLERLYDAGVYATLDEFKGRKPVQRGSLELPARRHGFDNPLIRGPAGAQTSGSRGRTSRVMVDFDFVRHEAAYVHLALEAHEVGDRPVAFWRPEPYHLLYAKVGLTPEKWFSTSPFRFDRGMLRESLFNAAMVLSGRLAGQPLPGPQFVHRQDASLVARWLAQKRLSGRPGLLVSNASPAIRVCIAAREEGLDISGSVFRIGGEPYTNAKAAAVESVGARAIVSYGLVELGTTALLCGHPEAPDDLHLLSDSAAVIQRQKQAGMSEPVGSLLFTSLLRRSPKVMINVESGDYGTLERRECGCLLGGIGFDTHLIRPRSYEKLTSEGVTFLGAELHRLVEEVLPGNFGGSQMDYQLVEEEEDGLPRVSVVVAPRVGYVDEHKLVQTVLDSLNKRPGGWLMTGEWRQSQTLRVLRREPYETRSSKVLPLHVLEKATPSVEA